MQKMMAHRTAMSLLLTSLLLVDVSANTTDLELAHLYSPILILAEDKKFPGRRVIHPEAVKIVGADSASNLWFNIGDEEIKTFEGWSPPLQSVLQDSGFSVDFSQNRFANLPQKFTYPGIPPGGQYGTYTVKPRFDYPGVGKDSWNNAYDNGDRAGKYFANTAYVRVFEHTFPPKSGSSGIEQTVTVIKYFYFYPYNDWWNNHEGD